MWNNYKGKNSETLHWNVHSFPRWAKAMWLPSVTGGHRFGTQIAFWRQNTRRVIFSLSRDTKPTIVLISLSKRICCVLLNPVEEYLNFNGWKVLQSLSLLDHHHHAWDFVMALICIHNLNFRSDITGVHTAPKHTTEVSPAIPEISFLSKEYYLLTGTVYL